LSLLRIVGQGDPRGWGSRRRQAGMGGQSEREIVVLRYELR
jgi:hypothetical protein